LHQKGQVARNRPPFRAVPALDYRTARLGRSPGIGTQRTRRLARAECLRVARARYNDLAQEWQIGVMTARDVLQVHSLLTWGATPWGREAVDYTRPHSSHAPAIGST
jgi:hypothetical protein